MSTDHVPPSEELLGEAARRIGDAYPGLYAHQRTGVSFLLSRRRAILADDMGLGKTRQAIVAVREAAPTGPFLVICPAGVKLNWRREIGLVEAEDDVQVLHGKDAFDPKTRWTVVNYDILSRFDDRFAQVEVGRRHRRRGALHQERVAPRSPGAGTPRLAGGSASRSRLPPHRHPDDQPAPRPLQPAQGGGPPARAQLLQLRAGGTAPPSTTATAWTRVGPRTSRSSRRSSRA